VVDDELAVDGDVALAGHRILDADAPPRGVDEGGAPHVSVEVAEAPAGQIDGRALAREDVVSDERHRAPRHHTLGDVALDEVVVARQVGHPVDTEPRVEVDRPAADRAVPHHRVVAELVRAQLRLDRVPLHRHLDAP
jgi:hypothetical protein